MVGSKLISNESVRTAIFDEKFQIILEKTIHNELKDLLSKEVGTLEDFWQH